MLKNLIINYVGEYGRFYLNNEEIVFSPNEKNISLINRKLFKYQLYTRERKIIKWGYEGIRNNKLLEKNCQIIISKEPLIPLTFSRIKKFDYLNIMSQLDKNTKCRAPTINELATIQLIVNDFKSNIFNKKKCSVNISYDGKKKFQESKFKNTFLKNISEDLKIGEIEHEDLMEIIMWFDSNEGKFLLNLNCSHPRNISGSTTINKNKIQFYFETTSTKDNYLGKSGISLKPTKDRIDKWDNWRGFDYQIIGVKK